MAVIFFKKLPIRVKKWNGLAIDVGMPELLIEKSYFTIKNIKIMRRIAFNPFHPTATVNFDRVFDEFFKPGFVNTKPQNKKPLVNVTESADDFKLEVAAPGLTKEDFKISVEKDQLIIAVSKENKTEEKTEKYARQEFNYTSFKRSFYLPETVESDAIGANYENGILTVSIPKKEVAKEKGPRLVEVG